MLAKMRNNALNMDENAYPQSLSAAYRIASGWVNEDFDRGFNGSDTEVRISDGVRDSKTVPFFLHLNTNLNPAHHS